LEGKVEEMAEVLIKTCDLILQSKWTLLTSFVSQKLSYLLSLQYPSDICKAASCLDDIL
jgi:hypothetical protein